MSIWYSVKLQLCPVVNWANTALFWPFFFYNKFLNLKKIKKKTDIKKKKKNQLSASESDLCNKISWHCLSKAVISMQQQEIINKKRSIRWVPHLRLPLPFAAALCSLPRVQQRHRRWLLLLLLLSRVRCLRKREMPFNEFHHSLFWWRVIWVSSVWFFFFFFLISFFFFKFLNLLLKKKRAKTTSFWLN